MDFYKIKKINLLFIFIIILLSLIGMAALYSAAAGNFDLWAKKHIIRFVISLILCRMRRSSILLTKGVISRRSAEVG